MKVIYILELLEWCPWYEMNGLPLLYDQAVTFKKMN